MARSSYRDKPIPSLRIWGEIPATDGVMFCEDVEVEEVGEPGPPEIDARKLPEWFHDLQRASCNSKAIDVVCVAGHQAGKTEAEVYFLLREIQRSAPFIASLGFGRAIFAGPTLRLLESQAIPSFQRLFEEHHQLGKYIGGNKPIFRFDKEGIQRLIGGCVKRLEVQFSYTNDSSNLESVTACCGTWDEAGQKENKPESYEAYNRRLTVARSTTFGQIKEWIDQDETRQKRFAWWVEWFYDVEGPDATFGRRMFGTTPYVWNFFKSKVHDLAEQGAHGFELFNFPTWANPRNNKEACFKARELMMDWKWVMMYEGKYTKPAGVIYDVYTKVKRIPIDPSWQRAAGHDFGKLNTAGVWAFEHPTNKSKLGTPQWVLYSSYKQGNRTAKEHSLSFIYGEDMRSDQKQDVYDLPKRPPEKWRVGRRRDEEGNWHPIPPWAWGGNRTTEQDSRELYGHYNYPIIEPPIPGVHEQIDVTYAMLKTEELVICEDLAYLLEEFDHFSNDLGDDGEPDEDKLLDEKKFHRLAAVRYLAAGLKKSSRLPERHQHDEEPRRDLRVARDAVSDESPRVGHGGDPARSGNMASRERTTTRRVRDTLR